MTRYPQWAVFSDAKKEGFDFTPHGHLSRHGAVAAAERLANIHTGIEFHVAKLLTSIVQRDPPPPTVITYNL